MGIREHLGQHRIHANVVAICLGATVALAGCQRWSNPGAEPGNAVAAREASTAASPATQDPPPTRERRSREARIVERAPRTVTVPAGTTVDVELVSSASSQKSHVGDWVKGQVAQPITVNGVVAIPAGSVVSGSVTQAHRLAKVGSRAELAIRFTGLRLPSGDIRPVELAFARTGRNETPKDAATIAGGTIAGIILGHQVASGRKAQVIGGLIGAGVGTAIAEKTHGQTIDLPAGTTLRLTLQGPVTVEIPG